MKSMRWRMVAWFGLCSALLLMVYIGLTYSHLEDELRKEHWQRDYPDHPDWNIHGSYSEAEVQQIMGELIRVSLLYGIPLLLVSIVVGFGLVNRSLKPISRLNNQLRDIRASNLAARIDLPEADKEFRSLVHNINELLARLDQDYTEMSEYAAKVAHELRTPLAILRLKVEQAGYTVPPEFAEQLQAELHQLAHIVDQSLLIAKAEQGRMVLQTRVFDLSQLLADVAEDFKLLAQEEDRAVRLLPMKPSPICADPKHVRQILHNLFTNALKHGAGNIRVRLSPRGGIFVLLITNGRRSRNLPKPEALGLGLRVVDTLLGLQQDITCRRRLGQMEYAVRLTFAAAEATALVQPIQELAFSDPGL